MMLFEGFIELTEGIILLGLYNLHWAFLVWPFVKNKGPLVQIYILNDDSYIRLSKGKATLNHFQGEQI